MFGSRSGIWFDGKLRGNKGDLLLKEAVYRIDGKTGAVEKVEERCTSERHLFFAGL